MSKSLITKKYLIVASLILLLVVTLSATLTLNGEERHEHKGHVSHVLDVPEEYKDMKNPYWTDVAAIVAGAKVYRKHCAECHGPHGKGDGSRASSMRKKPFNFEDSRHMSRMNDGYLYWRTMEGGLFSPFLSDMPAYYDVLTEEEVWQALSYAHAFSHRQLLAHVPGEDFAGVGHKQYEEKEGHKNHDH